MPDMELRFLRFQPCRTHKAAAGPACKVINMFIGSMKKKLGSQESESEINKGLLSGFSSANSVESIEGPI